VRVSRVAAVGDADGQGGSAGTSGLVEMRKKIRRTSVNGSSGADTHHGPRGGMDIGFPTVSPERVHHFHVIRHTSSSARSEHLFGRSHGKARYSVHCIPNGSTFSRVGVSQSGSNSWLERTFLARPWILTPAVGAMSWFLLMWGREREAGEPLPSPTPLSLPLLAW
jgi:hypothetical protein